jgi:hypothetical protein
VQERNGCSHVCLPVSAGRRCSNEDAPSVDVVSVIEVLPIIVSFSACSEPLIARTAQIGGMFRLILGGCRCAVRTAHRNQR